MKLERYPPSLLLRPFVRTFLVIESESGMENTVLPDTGIVMAFRFRGSVMQKEEGKVDRLPASVISGLRRSSRLLAYERQTANLLVTFTEGGAAAFFKAPLHELFGDSVSLDNFFPRSRLNDIEEQLAEAENDRSRIAIVERFLLSVIQESNEDRLILAAIQRIREANGNLSIKQLLAKLPVSRDPFEKRFRRATGASPKQFAGIIRMRHLIAHYSHAHTLTHVAYEAGYFDQAHFIKDFRTFTGQAPRDFFRSGAYW